MAKKSGSNMPNMPMAPPPKMPMEVPKPGTTVEHPMPGMGKGK